MSIAHELSSDVAAAAVLAAGEGEAPGDASERAELVLEVLHVAEFERRVPQERPRRKGRAQGPAAQRGGRGGATLSRLP